MSIQDEKAQRFSLLLQFLNDNNIECRSCDPCDCGCQCANCLEPLNGDASFRVYYRLKYSQEKLERHFKLNNYVGSLIIVDAPPSTQKNKEFVAINKLLANAKLLVPQILVADNDKGFMVLEDLGSKHFIDVAKDEEKLHFYLQALFELNKIASLPYDNKAYEQLASYRQKAIKLQNGAESLIPIYDKELDYIYSTMQALPKFDRDFILMELGICQEWLFTKALELKFTQEEELIIKNAFDFLAQELVSEPQVAMHRDYHSRNLMVVDNNLAVIDYQDMVLGPIGYDVASLVYDCYTVLPDAMREKLMAFSYELYTVGGLLDDKKVSLATFTRMVKLCALQRHIKCLGLFYRLKLRDGKDAYLQYLPTVINYVIENAKSFKELADFSKLLQHKL